MTSTPFHRDVLGDGCLRLVALEPSQAQGLLATTADDRVWRWMPAARPRTTADFAEWIVAWQQRRDDGYGIAFAAQLDGRVVGSSALYGYSAPNGTVEAGWTWLEPAQWGTATNRAMKLLMYDYAFDELEVERVGVRTDNLNLPAQRALDSLGLTREGVLRRHVRRPDGTMRDSVYYSILRDEWPRIRAEWLGDDPGPSVS